MQIKQTGPNEYELTAKLTKGKLLAVLLALKGRNSTLSQELYQQLKTEATKEGISFDILDS